MIKLEADIKFFKKIKQPDEVGVNIGWFEDQEYPDGTKIGAVATWNEFGTRQGIPQRPFLRRSVEEHGREWHELALTLVQRAIDENKSIDRAMLKVGERVKADIQETILAGGYRPNQTITLRGGWMRNKVSGKPFYAPGKGYGKPPLIDTGLMLRSVDVRLDKE